MSILVTIIEEWLTGLSNITTNFEPKPTSFKQSNTTKVSQVNILSTMAKLSTSIRSLEYSSI